MKKNTTLLIGMSNQVIKTGLGEAFSIIVEGFKNLGLDYHVVYIEGGLDQKQVVGTVSLLKVFRTFNALFKIWFLLFSSKNVYLTISVSKFGFLRDMLVILPSYIMGKRIVLHVHSGGYGEFYNSQSSAFQKLIRFTLSKANEIIVLGKTLTRQFSFLPHFEEKTSVVYNTLNLETRNNIQKTSPVEKGFISVLYLSNLVETKGYLDLLQACKILVEDGFTNFRCHYCGNFVTVIGDSAESDVIDQKQKFLGLIEGLGLADYVFYHGGVSGNKKIQILEESNLFVLPTKYKWEGQPISIIESLAYGIPVISTNYRSIPEQVINKYNGFLVDFDNPQQIAEKIKFLWNQPALYEQYSKNAREHFDKFFSRQSHLQKIIPIITGVDA